MRIIGGRFRGRRLAGFPGNRVRPTSDRVREAVFNVLASAGAVEGARVLDLFAGTGAMAIEALSRGAAGAVLVDNDPASVKIIMKNLGACGIEDEVRVMTSDVVRAVRNLGRKGEAFDLVFIDPPYEEGLETAAIEALEAERLVSPGGVVVVETSVRSAEGVREAEIDGLGLADERKYGDTAVLFYTAETDGEER